MTRTRDVRVARRPVQGFSFCKNRPCLGRARPSLAMSLSLPWTRLVPRWPWNLVRRKSIWNVCAALFQNSVD